MKCIIVYFSLTGNTEKVAKAIQKGVKQAAGNCELVNIKEANPYHLYQYDLIGLGTPLFGESANIRGFLDNLHFVGGKHIFAFNTHASLPETYYPTVYPKLKEKGLVVIGMRDWYGDCFLSNSPRPYPTGGHPDETDLKEAADYGREMVENSRRIHKGETNLIPPPPPPARPSSELGVPKGGWFSEAAIKFPDWIKYHREKCLYPKCRLCMDNCPADGIDLSVNPPVTFKPCMHCEFCSKICPTGAIELDGGFMEFTTEGLHKDVREIFLPILEKAEKEGHFRRKVPVKDIGWDTPLYKLVQNKHPQWKTGKGLQLPDSFK